MKLILWVTLLLLLNFGCSQSSENLIVEKGLKDYYNGYFYMGASLSPGNITGPDTTLILAEFNSITAENIMKMGPIHPEEDNYHWGMADTMIQFARRHNLKVRGHTLCWHNQVGDWMFKDEDGNEVTKDLLLQRLKEHIYAVAGRYKDDIYAWDVVNEVISDQADEFFRPSKWYQICGEDFIYKAFQYAHEAAPNAKLFYNDYSATKPEKREKIIKLLTDLLAADIPVHGMGIQGHWSIYGPKISDIEAAIKAYSELGLEVQITELDISVYPSESGRRDKQPDESDVFSDNQIEQQVEMYRSIFKVFRDYKDVITGVTFWNLSDKHSWLDNFPVRGRKNYPLLFDEKGDRKKAYDAVANFERDQ